MRHLALIVLLATSALPIGAAEITKVGPFSFHSSFWINLHETLIHCATAKTPCDLASLTGEERAEWNAALQMYREAGRGESINFSRPMSITRDVLSQLRDDEATPELRPPAGPALLRAASIYRRHFWPDTDRANRFWIAYVTPMVRDAGDELMAGHAKAYATPWPDRIRIDATRHAGQFGAYTLMGRLAGVHASVAVGEPGNYGVGALETIFHEASHAIVGRNNGTVATTIRKHADRLGIEPPVDLWHAILFATTSELTRRALERRGIHGYTVQAEDLYRRVWPNYRQPIQQHWIAYLDGRISFDQAIERTVEAAPKPR